MSSDDVLARLGKAGEDATPGPWKECGDILQGRSAIRTASKDLFCSYDEMSMQNANDARFVALARNAWGPLLAVVSVAYKVNRECDEMHMELAEAIVALERAVGQEGGGV